MNPTRVLALPAGLLFLAGTALIFFALHGLDAKHGLLGHRLADANVSAPTLPQTPMPAGTISTPSPGTQAVGQLS